MVVAVEVVADSEDATSAVEVAAVATAVALGPAVVASVAEAVFSRDPRAGRHPDRQLRARLSATTALGEADAE